MNILLEQAKHKKNFYRNIYRFLLRLLLVSFALIMLLLALNLFYFLRKPVVDYYATSTDGQIFQIKSMEQAPPYADFSNITYY